MGVESEIREALINLILNAVDHARMAACSRCRTKVPGRSNPAGRSCPHRGSRQNGLAWIEEPARRCLEPFCHDKGERGTGLGLAMVYGRRVSVTAAQLESPAILPLWNTRINDPSLVPAAMRIVMAPESDKVQLCRRD